MDVLKVLVGVESKFVFHPYDGGADVILPSTEGRDTLRDAHASWLSKRSDGY